MPSNLSFLNKIWGVHVCMETLIFHTVALRRSWTCRIDYAYNSLQAVSLQALHHYGLVYSSTRRLVHTILLVKPDQHIRSSVGLRSGLLRVP